MHYSFSTSSPDVSVNVSLSKFEDSNPYGFLETELNTKVMNTFLTCTKAHTCT